MSPNIKTINTRQKKSQIKHKKKNKKIKND